MYFAVVIIEKLITMLELFILSYKLIRNLHNPNSVMTYTTVNRHHFIVVIVKLFAISPVSKYTTYIKGETLGDFSDLRLW